MKHLLYLSCISIAILTLFSCKKEREKVYSVPSEIETYVRNFEAEGNGQGLDLVIDDLEIVYATNLMLNGTEAAGICTYETSESAPFIQLDTTSENWTAHASSREVLVYHELGHCILDREHINTKLPNGNYKSIMKSTGEPIYASFSEFKRDYYIQELFDPFTVAPDWSQFSYDDNVGTRIPVHIEEFSNNFNGWDITFVENPDTEVNLSIGDGVYRLQNNIESPSYVYQNWPIDENKDFEIEMRMQVLETDGFFNGLIWGSRNETPNSDALLRYVAADPSKMIWLIDQDFDEYTTLPSPVWNLNSYNKITLRRQGDFIQFFINETPHDVISFKEFYGDVIGILVAGNTTIEVDYLKIYEINP